MKSMTGKELAKLLEKHGWTLTREQASVRMQNMRWVRCRMKNF